MTADDGVAPGGPGKQPHWTSSAKSGVGTATSPRSMVWFTVGRGILNEVYYPRVDQANVRDMEMIVTAEPDFFAEEKRDTRSSFSTIAPGVPGFRISNACTRGRFRIDKTLIADPERDVLLLEHEFVPLQGSLSDYRLFVLLAPHLGNQGFGNTGWIGDYKGMQGLFAQREDLALTLACSSGFADMSCGFVGVNDGWQQLSSHRRLTHCYSRAAGGNIALTGQIDLAKCGGRFVLALAFGRNPDEAGHAARAGLLTPFEYAHQSFVSGWQTFHATSRTLGTDGEIGETYRMSIAALQAHEDKVRRGAFIASLSVPWGNDRGDRDLGGYHVVWPRDLVEIAGGLLAAGHPESARHALHYLMTTQEPDGHWPQNMWLDGRAYWPGDQLDETALPILLADQLRRRRALRRLNVWPMIRRAAEYLVRHGPVTQEDRWEEDGGYTTFTLAIEIAALLAAAEFAEHRNEHTAARYLRETADIWNDSIERWTYVSDTDLAKRVGVDGYFVRIAPKDGQGEFSGPGATHRPTDYSGMVSPDALALVRFGLRAPDDERILNTIRVIDSVLCTETPNGPTWHRYNGDKYGEYEDGAPYDGGGVGRGWPLLAGERGHYELAAGRSDRARELLDVMRRQTGLGGLIPEQVWDAADIPDKKLFAGCPTGSAMPLAWAHAEFVKLIRSLYDGHVFDTPPETMKRYVTAKQPCNTGMWRFNNKISEMEVGRVLRLEVRDPAVAHWSVDDWQTVHDDEATDTTMRMWIVDLPTSSLPVGTAVRFTFYWPQAGGGRWEGTDFAVKIVAPS